MLALNPSLSLNTTNPASALDYSNPFENYDNYFIRKKPTFGFGVVPFCGKFSSYVEYFKSDASEEEIVEVLKDTKYAGRSFFGYKKKITSVIASAENRQAALINLNILMNTKNKSLKAGEILKYLTILTDANNFNSEDELKEFSL